jgi:choline dehydrogenase
MMRRRLLGFSGIPLCSFFPFPSTSLFSLLWTLAAASPVHQDKRQLNGFLASLAGTLGSQQSFDYIILGDGTASLTTAKRLTGNKVVTVAAIEAWDLYQVAASVLFTTPAGDVAFVGMPSGSRPRYSWGGSNQCEGTKESLATVGWGFYTAPDPALNSIVRAYTRGKSPGVR